MSSISMFHGIIIRMFWRDNDQHRLPHIHAYYGDYVATFTLDGEIFRIDPLK